MDDARETEQIDMEESVRLLRLALEREFPGVDFEVEVTDDEARITWRDGPTQREVNRIAWSYAGWGFGEYSLEPTEHYLMPNGVSVRAAGPGGFLERAMVPEGSRRVRFAPTQLWIERKLSPSFRDEIVRMIEDSTGQPLDLEARTAREIPFQDVVLRGIGAQIVWQASCVISKVEQR